MVTVIPIFYIRGTLQCKWHDIIKNRTSGVGQACNCWLGDAMILWFSMNDAAIVYTSEENRLWSETDYCENMQVIWSFAHRQVSFF